MMKSENFPPLSISERRLDGVSKQPPRPPVTALTSPLMTMNGAARGTTHKTASTAIAPAAAHLEEEEEEVLGIVGNGDD